MYPTTLGALKAEFPHRPTLVAAMGAIPKPDGSVRPVHDGTHFVQLNNKIISQDQLQYPGPLDIAGVMRWVAGSGEAVFVLSADIASAHRLVKVRKRDWPLLCCKADSGSKVVWVNKVGTFGVSSAPYWWTRLFGCIGRLASRILMRQLIMQVTYVDDLQMAAVGPDKFSNLLALILVYEVIGTPFSYKKFGGGLETQFVGYRIDYKASCLGIARKRGDALCQFVQEMKRNSYTVSMRRFAEFLGRLGFVARVFPWLKPQLSPLYSWSAAIDRGTVATAPKMIRLVLLYIERELSQVSFLHDVRKPWKSRGEVFRTDAKCDLGFVVFGGHDFSGRWFSLRVTRQEAPYLFKDDGSSQWASAPAELLATMIGMHAFGCFDTFSANTTFECTIFAGTDNRSNESLTKSSATTRWPLMLVNMQLSHLLMKAGVRLSLRWRPRDQNVLADDLTNEVFDQFDADKRVGIQWGDLDLSLLNSLWESREEFLDREYLREMSKPDTSPFAKTKW